MNVAFVNENTLGHTSYLPRFARRLEARPELGVTPHLLDVTPLPPALAKRADFTIRGLRKIGLDFHLARWRQVTSRHARALVDDLRRRQRIDALVVNTQSVGLALADLSASIPLVVCLDATFEQLRRSEWFSMNRVAGWFTPLTLSPLRGPERRLYAAARRLLPWSAPVRESLRVDYGVPADRIEVLPPSLDLSRLRGVERGGHDRPQILFLGGDFHRKGGAVLLEAFRRDWADQAELHVITQSAIEPEPGVSVHRGVAAQSDRWFERWTRADVFVFPSRLETFGIVLLEALAFEVPVVASRAGAAVDILEDGANGLLVPEITSGALSRALGSVFRDRDEARRRAARGRARVERDYDLDRNTEKLAELLKAVRSA